MESRHRAEGKETPRLRLRFVLSVNRRARAYLMFSRGLSLDEATIQLLRQVYARSNEW